MEWEGLWKFAAFHSWLLSPFRSDREGKPVRLKEAPRHHLGLHRWVLFKRFFGPLEHPRTTGCSLSWWSLNADSAADKRCSSFVNPEEEAHNSFMIVLPTAKPFSFLWGLWPKSPGSWKLTFPWTPVMPFTCS